MSDDQRIDTLNTLLRGELAAAETYRAAADTLDGEPSLRELLAALRTEHENVAASLHSRVVVAAAEPAERAAPWGWFAQPLTDAAHGGDPVRQFAVGERELLSLYAAALREPALDVESRREIESTLMPRRRGLVEQLESQAGGGSARRAGEQSAPPRDGEDHHDVDSVLASNDLTHDEKIARLQQMNYEGREAEVATEEGMPPPSEQPPRRDRVLRALRQLGVDEERSDSKH